MMNVKKAPLPSQCVPSFPENRQLKTMTSIEGVVIRSFDASKAKPSERFSLDACWKLYADLNLPGVERGLILPKSYQKRHYISTHYFIGRSGEIWELIPPPIRAFHAGKTQFQGRDYCTSWMIGVSVIGDAVTPYEEDQYNSLAILIREFMSAYGFDAEMVTTLSEVAIPLGRSTEPGGSFDKEKLLRSLGYVKMTSVQHG